MRLGIRVQDLLDPKILRQKIEIALAEKNLWLERMYGENALELEHLAARPGACAARRRPPPARPPGAAGRKGRFVRGRTGDPPRPRPRGLSLRPVVEHGCGERGC